MVDGSSRITIQAIIDSWVEVLNRRSQLLFTRVLRQGDRYHVPDLKGLSLVTGNAGGLEFMVDGEKVPSIRPSVRLTVEEEGAGSGGDDGG